MTFLYLIITFAILGILIFYVLRRENEKYDKPVYLNYLQQISQFHDHIQTFDDYITWVERDRIKSKYEEAGNYFRHKTFYYRKEETVKKFNEIFSDFDNYVAQFNQGYVEDQKDSLSSYFDNIEGKRLDNQQRTAIITDEYSNLIIAGAGSGKTLTILGKIQYLIQKKNVKPNHILLLSFTKKTVEELNQRLRQLELGIEATTFHKLGYDILKRHLSNTPAVTNENTLGNVIKKYLKEDIFKDPAALQSYIEYVACFMNIPEESDSYKSFGEKIDDEKGIDFHTLKSKCEPLNKIAKDKLNTLQGERVKSVEELMIANFLYLNGIAYEYEKPYPHGTGMYRPDFYISDYDIYLEHFGVDQNNKAAWLDPFYEQKYIDEMALKRETHRLYQTKLIETYSYYNRDKVLLQKLRELLQAEGVKIMPIDTKKIYAMISENDKNFGKEIIKLIESFINLSKSRRLDQDSLKAILSTKSKFKNKFMIERQEMFSQFVFPILEKYDEALKEKNEIDFNDMINQATDVIKRDNSSFPYSYIIVDEYQDISVARFNLIKEIREGSAARLICVGDDWQSIYRFAGSDISLFSRFGTYVGKHEQLKIEQTYRNSQELIDITSKYIKKNPKQISKSPKSKKEHLENPVKFIHYKEEDIENTFIHQVQSLVDTYGKKSILVLGRHSFDIDDLIKLSQNNRIKYNEHSGQLLVKGFEDVSIQFLTVHKSKGTEADNVIILNLRNSLLGFPNKMTDDPILSLLLSDDEQYKYAEERRLFYVALTRTKNEAILLIPSDASLFAEELITDNGYLLSEINGEHKTTNCLYCKTGKVVIRQKKSNGKQFLGCSHFPQCNQTYNTVEILESQFICPSCESGYMTKRTGQYGNFLGCSNYPRCKNTINLAK